MTRYDSVIFDLDGTLWDAAETSAQGWNFVLDGKGLGVNVSAADIRQVSGMPFEACVAALFRESQISSDSEFQRALDDGERLLIEDLGGQLFGGVADGIERLSRQYRLFLVSNCQEWYLDAFWSHFALKRFFSGWDCYGSSRAAKAEMIGRLVRARSAGCSIYIGDTDDDRLAATSAEVDFGYASYGFGQAESATIVFSSFPELVAWFEQSAAPNNAMQTDVEKGHAPCLRKGRATSPRR